VAAVTARGRGRELDERAYRTLNGIGGRRAGAAFRAITELGSIWASVGATVVLSASGRRREGVNALGAAGTTWLAGQALKKIYLRPRPYHALPDVHLLIGEPRGTSWPSSHPAVLLAFLTVAGRNLDLSAQMRLALAGLAGAVGLSRVHLGVHYPADVAGGLLLGRAMADLWSAAVPPGALRDRRAGARLPGRARVQ
jgi:membrane-associated phospholipid phosphatase